MDTVSLSKEISYALRHRPQDYGLVLDEYGWTSLDALINALSRQKRYSSLTINDIELVIAASDKTRFEINGDKIRALYGHSTDSLIVRSPTQPPDILYHGTAQRFVDSIFDSGLISKDRQYVHLATDTKTAELVGRRRDSEPVIIIVDAKLAWDKGILFYDAGHGIWLADFIPAEYLHVTGTHGDRFREL